MDETPARPTPQSGTIDARPSHDLDMHQLRTPLTIAMLRLSLLRRRLRRDSHDPGLEDGLQQIEEALKRLAAVITEMDEATRPR